MPETLVIQIREIQASTSGIRRIGSYGLELDNLIKLAIVRSENVHSGYP